LPGRHDPTPRHIASHLRLADLLLLRGVGLALCQQSHVMVCVPAILEGVVEPDTARQGLLSEHLLGFALSCQRPLSRASPKEGVLLVYEAMNAERVFRCARRNHPSVAVLPLG